MGIPSSQAGNCFIDTLHFRLDKTGIRGNLSYKASRSFPGDPEMGEVLRPHRELTYEIAASMDFDPNASVLLALQLADDTSTWGR